MSDESTLGREPITIVELDQDFCTREYGLSPCTAAIGVTGSFKCYNTRKTCQDSANYSVDSHGFTNSLTISFTQPRANLQAAPGEIGTLFPTLIDVSSRPSEINIEDGLGTRASVTITLRDHPYHDRYVDPYWQTRGIDAINLGTFWSKWLRRNPYYQGRAIRIRDGYIGQLLGDMRTRHYVIENIEGPNASGEIRITAKDPLKMTDGDRAVAPLPSSGSLLADINAAAVSATLAPTGIGSTYPASGTARVGEELVTFARSGDVLTLVRGQGNTTAEDQEAGSTVQVCLVYQDEAIADALYDLLVGYTDIPATSLPKTDWDETALTWLASFNLTGVITQPTSVKKILTELLQTSMSYMWWDEVAQEVKWDAIHPPLQTPQELNEDQHLIQNSIAFTAKPEDRVSQVWVYFAPILQTKDLDKPSNYKRLRVYADTDAESVQEYGQKSIRIIYARFFDETNDGEVIALAARTLARNRDTPRIAAFSLDAKDRAIMPGDVVELITRDLIDENGYPESQQYQIIRRDETEAGHLVQYVALPYTFLYRYAYVMPDGSADYDGDPPDRAGYISQNDGTMINDDDAYRII